MQESDTGSSNPYRIQHLRLSRVDVSEHTNNGRTKFVGGALRVGCLFAFLSKIE